jgi:hypothetical protein
LQQAGDHGQMIATHVITVTSTANRITSAIGLSITGERWIRNRASRE